MYISKYDELKQQYKELLKEHKDAMNKLSGYKAAAREYDRLEAEYRKWIDEAKNAKVDYDWEVKRLHLIRAKYQEEMREAKKTIKELQDTIKKLQEEKQNDNVEA
ncbi:MAG: hypothetical protein IKO07_07410 [Clostridia bacterium]|nr:hypothetical protein [Clostridia bacterium]